MLLIPLIKADSSQRRVYARLTESVDRGNEAMDYVASAPVIKAWSDMQLAASGGKSRGNVRGQHGRVVAGIVSDIQFDDVAKTIDFEIDVIDEGEWEKVIKGAYTGISPGGKGVRRKDPDGVVRYGLTQLNEISLVDVPAIPDAMLTVLKADGIEERIAFAPAQEGVDLALIRALGEAPNLRSFTSLVVGLPADAVEKALGAASGIDGKASLFSAAVRRELAAAGVAMPDGSFPITDQDDLEGALLAVEKASATGGGDVQAHLVARAGALGLSDVLPEAWAKPEAVVEKGLGAVSELAQLIQQLAWLAGSVTNEAAFEGDGSPIPGRLAAWIEQGADILTGMAGEEAAEAVAALTAAVAALPMPLDADVQKAAGLGAEGVGVLVKLAGDLAGARGEIEKSAGVIADLRAEVARLQAQPAPGGIRLRAVGRGEDVTTVEKAADPEAALAAMPNGFEKAATLTRLALANAIRS